jgi:hypothetical protein
MDIPLANPSKSVSAVMKVFMASPRFGTEISQALERIASSSSISGIDTQAAA